MTIIVSDSRRFLFCLGCVALGLVCSAVNEVSAKTSTWTDAQGATLRGEPAEILGPWALFKTGSRVGRRVLLRGLPPEDSRRFSEEISHRPARAGSWAEAQAAATEDVVGHVLQLKNNTLVPADLTRIREPDLLLVLYGSHNDGESWQMLNGTMNAVYERAQRVYPGVLGAVFIGIHHNEVEHRKIALGTGIPWLIANYIDEEKMHVVTQYVPAEGTNMVLLSREGVPLLAARATDRNAIREFADQLSDILWQIDPANPHSWKDRVAYLAATRPVAFAHSRSDPLLIGSPLRATALRKYGVTRVRARLEVAADGKVSPTLNYTAAEVPSDLAGPLTEALMQALVVPAIDHGVAVAGELDYNLDIPAENRQVEADAIWLSSATYPALPIEQWLVLRPIKVSEQDFVSTVESETPTGTLVFKTLQVTNAKVSRAAQMNAFNTDWFTAVGAASVQPKEGEKQTVDDKELTWQRIKADKGYVNMQTGIADQDYSVGYAWTEFDVPAEGNAWLGLGSDDGVKLWLNGELIHDKWIRRPSRIDDDIVPLHLKPGRNRILIKIQNATGEWSFLYRIRAASK